MKAGTVYVWPRGDDRYQWITTARNAAASRMAEGSLGDLGRQHPDAVIWLLIPGAECLVTYADIPTRQRRQVMRAAPYAVEDQLIGEIERYHFAAEPTGRGNEQLIVAIDQDVFARHVDPFAQAGIRLHGALPDHALLPKDEGASSLVVMADGDRRLLRDGNQFYAIDESEFDGYLSLLAPQSITLVGREPVRLPVESDDLPVTRTDANAPPLQALAGSKPAVNLLQGQFSSDNPDQHRAFSVLRWAVAALLLSVGIELTARFVQLQRLDNQLIAMRAESESLLTSRFPDIGRVVDPRIQMQQQLERLQTNQGAGGSALLGLIEAVGPPILADAQIRLSGFDYRNGELNLDLIAPELARIETLRQQFAARGLNTSLASASTREGQALGRIRVDREPGQ